MPGDPMTWRRDDRRESFLAPQIHLHQALTWSGRTVSGVAESAAEARARAVSETAEIAALEACNPASLPRRFLPTRDGIAAAATVPEAQRLALLEACERRGVSDWWLGQGPGAARLPERWCRQTGLAAWLDALRAGADLRRATDLWRLPCPVPIALVVARSVGSAGQSPMLGYGCAISLEAAARKAILEVLLMEICVMDDYVARAFGTQGGDRTARRQMTDFAARLPGLLPQSGPAAAVEDPSGALFEGARPARVLIDWLAGPVALSALRVPGCAFDIAVCQPLGARPVLMAGPGSPFVGAPDVSDGAP